MGLGDGGGDDDNRPGRVHEEISDRKIWQLFLLLRVSATRTGACLFEGLWYEFIEGVDRDPSCICYNLVI